MQVETLLERTDRMLKAISTGSAPESKPAREMTSLWQSGLSSSLLFSVSEPAVNAAVEKEAKIIISRYLETEQQCTNPISTSGLVDFQNQLQMRSKVISAVEMLLRG
jgi:hypothetical protein